MTETSTSVRDVILLPEADPKKPGGKWKELHDKLGTEVKGIKWVSMPALVERIGELLEIEIPDLLLGAWKKCDELQAALEETKKSPQLKIHVGMAEHNIVSEHNPYIEMRLAKMPAQKIPFKLKLTFKLKACELLVQGGLIKQARPGSCEVEGTLSQGLLVLASKKLAPIKLPGAIPTDRKLEAQKQR